MDIIPLTLDLTTDQCVLNLEKPEVNRRSYSAEFRCFDVPAVIDIYKNYINDTFDFTFRVLRNWDQLNGLKLQIRFLVVIGSKATQIEKKKVVIIEQSTTILRAAFPMIEDLCPDGLPADKKVIQIVLKVVSKPTTVSENRLESLNLACNTYKPPTVDNEENNKRRMVSLKPVPGSENLSLVQKVDPQPATTVSENRLESLNLACNTYKPPTVDNEENNKRRMVSLKPVPGSENLSLVQKVDPQPATTVSENRLESLNLACNTYKPPTVDNEENNKRRMVSLKPVPGSENLSLVQKVDPQPATTVSENILESLKSTSNACSTSTVDNPQNKKRRMEPLTTVSGRENRSLQLEVDPRPSTTEADKNSLANQLHDSDMDSEEDDQLSLITNEDNPGFVSTNNRKGFWEFLKRKDK